MSSISVSMQYGGQAMNSLSWGMATTAHNLANVNTAGFKPQHPVYATGPDGWGVQVEAVLQDVTARGQQPATVQRDVSNSVGPADASVSLGHSATDVAREMANMVATNAGYTANAKVLATADAMLGYLLDVKA